MSILVETEFIYYYHNLKMIYEIADLIQPSNFFASASFIFSSIKRINPSDALWLVGEMLCIAQYLSLAAFAPIQPRADVERKSGELKWKAKARTNCSFEM